MSLFERTLSIGFILAIFQTSCGAKVVVDAEGQGGSDSGAPIPSAEACKSYCDANTTNGCFEDKGTCATTCGATVENTGECASRFNALLACYGQNVTSPADCQGILPACVDEAQDFQTCVASQPCTELGSCSVTASTCKCTNDCGGALLESDCDMSPGGMCDCRFNGELVGTCPFSKDHLEFACSNLSGCCAGLFAASH